MGGLMFNIVASSTMYRPTEIASEEEKEKEKDLKAEEEEADGGGLVDFSIFKDMGYLLFFISQGVFFAGYV